MPSFPVLRSAPRRAAHQKGITLVEAACVLAIASTLVGATITAFDGAASRRHLEGVATQFETDVFFTRSTVAAHQQGLRISFASSESGTCYVIHRPSAHDCRCDPSGRPVCEGAPGVLRSEHFPAGGPVRIEANVRSMLFDPVRGTVTPTGTVRVVARRDSGAIHQIVSLVGRVRSCSPQGMVSGVPAC